MSERSHFILNRAGPKQDVMRRRGHIRGMGKTETGSAKRGMNSFPTFLFLVP